MFQLSRGASASTYKVQHKSFSFSFIEYAKRFDKFGYQVPSFNVKGQSKVSSSLGSLLTIVSLVIIIIYALAKTTHL